MFEKYFQEAINSGGALVAIDSKSKNIIGSSRYNGYNMDKSEIEIGWTFLARSFWGGIYNKEMKKLMLEHAFKFVNSVIFVVGIENFCSQLAVLKIGGEQVGIGKDDGGNKSYIYQILKSDYVNQ